MKRIMQLIGLLLCGALLVAACDSGKSQQNAQQKDQQSSAQGLVDLQRALPTPKFDYSQIRKNLIEIETAQATSVATTSFFFNQGIKDPVHVCPSIGFPIASDTQLTNPQQVYRNGDGSHDVIAQVDPSGIFAGPSTGTYVICIDATGKAYANYFEGFVQTVTGPAVWKDGQVQLVGPPSFSFSKGK